MESEASRSNSMIRPKQGRLSPGPSRPRLRVNERSRLANPRTPWIDAVTLGLMTSMRALPAGAAGFSGEALGRLASFVGARNNSKARANLVRAGVVDVSGACRRGWGHSGRTAFEMLWMLSRCPTRMLRRTHVEGFAELAAAVDEGKGALLVSAHTGNWELVPIAAARLGTPVSVVARSIRAARLERRIIAWRRRGGVTTLIRGAAGSSISAFRTLSRGGVLGCMVDRASTGPRIPTPFLGGITSVPEGPLTLAQRTGAAVVLGMAGRVEGRPTVVFRRVPSGASQSKSEIAATIMRSIEAELGDHPEAWLWIHRRQPGAVPTPQSDVPPINLSATSASSGTEGSSVSSRETVLGIASR